jgi:cobalt/nickel transport system permease protein
MHIAEGIITGSSAVAYTGAGMALMGWGASRMKKFVRNNPEKMPLLGMGGALIFFVSLIPIPAFTGTCSHPCGTPLIGILLGPVIGFALTGISLLMQAAFFAHGGFSTWGANLVSLGFFGCFFGWGTFRLARRIGLPLWAAGCAGGLVGDVMVYAASGMILGTTLSHAPHPQYTLSGYLSVIYAAYLPTQLPIAIGEMLLTGLALHHAYRQRPDVLKALGVIGAGAPVRSRIFHLLAIPALCTIFLHTGMDHVFAAEATVKSPTAVGQAQDASGSGRFAGMDEAVNSHLAAVAGKPSRVPYIDIEKMGDLWNLLLLGTGAACGFIVGRWWHLLWSRPPETHNTMTQRNSSEGNTL